MVRKLVFLLFVFSLALPVCAWAAKIDKTSIQPIKFKGRTFCTVFSINQKEGNWASAAHCAAFVVRMFNESKELPTIADKAAYVAYVDPFVDVAVFQSEMTAPALVLSRKTSKVGDSISIRGYPYGITEVRTMGSVGARNIPIEHPSYLIQMRSDILDITVAGGNSGSPVLNRDNKVIGLLWGRFLQSEHSLSIPLESLRRAFSGFLE